MAKLFILSLILAISLSHSLATDLNEFEQSLNAGSKVNDIAESYISYDLHKDLHYFRDDYVNEAFSRKKFNDIKVTMAGQAKDMTDRVVQSAHYPFAVGMKSLGKLGVSTDRWDVKVNSAKQQFVALYHGYSSNFVVNKLRANLLRRVANAVKDYLPTMDQAQASDLEQYRRTVFDDVTDIVKTTLQDVDGEIRELMNDNDDSSATATVMIVTDNYLIVANVGDNNAIAYNSANEIVNLTPSGFGQQTIDQRSNLFGARKSRSHPCQPEVGVYPRNFLDEDGDPAHIHYVILESPLVSDLVSDEEASKIVLREVVQHAETPEQEQSMYENSVTNILETASNRVTGISKAFFPELFQKSDYATIVVGLDRDYKNIH